MSTFPTPGQLDAALEKVNAMVDTVMQKKVPGFKMHDPGRMKYMAREAVDGLKSAVAAGNVNDTAAWLSDHVAQGLTAIAAEEAPDLAQREPGIDREAGRHYYDSQKVELKFVMHCLAEVLGVKQAYTAACSQSEAYAAAGR